MTCQRSRMRTYDSKESALKYSMVWLQGLCAGPTDIEAIREVTVTLRRTTQLFFDSRQRHLNSMLEDERNTTIIKFSELIDKLKTIQRQAHEMLAAVETSSSTLATANLSSVQGTHYLLTETAPNRRSSWTKTSDNSITPPEKKTRSESCEEMTPRVLLANTRGPTRIRFQSVKAISSGANGQRLTVNCLFDSGAEQTLVTEDTARALGLVGMAETVTVKGIGGIHYNPTLARRVRFRLSSVKANDHDPDVEPIKALTLPRIKEQDEKLPVHMLIGVDSYGRFFGEKILRGNPTEPVAIERTLGWVVLGPMNPPSTSQYRFHCAQKEDDMEYTLKKFWELESIGIQQQEDKTTQDAEAPGVVRLPDNHALGERRLRSVERSLRIDPTKQREYYALIEEYLRNGWAEEVPTQMGQPVYKMADGQTKCRVVFNGLAKCAGVSLNDQLETEPNLQADLESNEKVRKALANMYADDLVMSCDKEAEVRNLIRRVPLFLGKGGFHLKKWTSNQTELLSALPREVSTNGQRKIRKTLGVYWKKDEDVLTFKPPPNLNTQSCSTMRQMLSLAARVYDPLGTGLRYTITTRDRKTMPQLARTT
ncbi:hypothetical protein T07_12726 [Trichinella nelsoni]|uniref:Peptidase A2 domain-containing protein n=1 Tax=Trichinella nelsoni TaxID=6336 RepID=A0A0V0S046_9BILA|nr:hypothetical protein T07_12726 [Trichinella nelsoni]